RAHFWRHAGPWQGFPAPSAPDASAPGDAGWIPLPAPKHRGLPRLLLDPGPRHARHLDAGLGHDPHADVRRDRQLRRPPHPGRGVPPGAGQHGLLRGRHRAGRDRAQPAARARHERSAPRHHLLPGRLLRAGDHLGRRGGDGLAVALQPRFRPHQPGAPRGRPAGHPVAVVERLGDAGDHLDGDLEAGRLRHGDLPGRPAGDPAAALRGGPDRRRGSVAPLLAHHAAAADADDVLHLGHLDHRLVPGVRPRLHPDVGWAGERDEHDGDVRLQPGVPILPHGLRRGGCLGAVPDHPGDHAGAVAHPEALGALRMTLRLVPAYALFAVGSVVMLAPFLWMVSTSLKANADVFVYPPIWIPDPPQWGNYVYVLELLPFGRYLLNTTFVATTVTVLEVLTSSLAGFAFARVDFPGRDRLFLIYLATLMVPGQVTLIPNFLVVSWLGWNNTYLALIIPAAFGTFLLRQFFLSIPVELEQAARIDGCGYFGIYRHIILPLSGPAVATLTIFVFMVQWNSFLWPLIV